MTAPIAAVEAKLREILADVLEVDVVRPQDGFFEVGGDSVRALQVVARAREAGLVLTVRDLFDHQSAQALAVAISGPATSTGEANDATSAVSSRLAFTDDEFGDFEDVEMVQQTSGSDAGWETFT